MARDIDALTSAALKHVRERWWDEAFTSFLRETLQPRPGNRLLDVGCGGGTAELNLGLSRVSQIEVVGVDIRFRRVRDALVNTRAHNVGVGFAAADAAELPFPDGSFDSTFCVAVLQHLGDVEGAVAELARVTRPGGRVLAVEPDNSARYWYSSSEIGRRAFDVGGRFFASLAAARGDVTDPAIGPKLPGLFARRGLEPLAVRLFPVSVSRLGAPPASVWDARRDAIQHIIGHAPDESIRRLGADYLKLLDRYAAEASAAGPSFVEIQNTMLFATVGQRPN
jgi:SAM-dependent methyltransferase